MARPNRHLDVDRVESLIAERDLAIKDIARKMARTRYRRAPNENEVENERRSLQRWLGGAAIEARGQQLLAKALGEPADSLLLPQELDVSNGEAATQPAPIAVMLEALANQREMKAHLEALEGAVAAVADGVRETLEMLRAAQQTRQAGRG